jgi:hypothetical protein
MKEAQRLKLVESFKEVLNPFVGRVINEQSVDEIKKVLSEVVSRELDSNFIVSVLYEPNAPMPLVAAVLDLKNPKGSMVGQEVVLTDSSSTLSLQMVVDVGVDFDGIIE